MPSYYVIATKRDPASSHITYEEAQEMVIKLQYQGYLKAFILLPEMDDTVLEKLWDELPE
jgi:hypothetical protein